ncbi:MAG: hypothetical protein C6Y20_21095 [Tagaea sp. CACIAM 22H2]|nr:hypothetical protein [Tagaea sp. CACIAM 22H2]
MSLPAIRDFAQEGYDPARYQTLGPDWFLAVADVEASTKLAGAGRDRDVNFVAGAAVAVLSTVATKPPDMTACQFGGDGAIAAVSPGCEVATRAALAALAYWAQTEIDIPLRVGLVPVKALIDAGHDARAALQDFGGGNVFGQFLGSGIAAADAWVKADGKWRIAPAPGELPGIEGLSCRWQPVPARRGHVLCVIVDPAPGAAGEAALARLLAEFERIVPGATAAPLGDGGDLAPKGIPAWRALRNEMRAQKPGARLARLAAALGGMMILKTVHALGGKLGRIDTKHYTRTLAERSDHRKLAGGPRFVLDVTDAEEAAIQDALTREEAAGAIAFGTARADSTTITCLVGDFMADRHVHFVDGDGLGFWRAASALKAKRAA